MSFTTLTFHVVDRDPIIQRSVTTLARGVRAKLEVHRTCGEFFDTYSPEVPSCLAIDVTSLSSRDLEALGVLGSRYDPIAVVALSANASVSQAVRVLKAGATDFIEKPCGIEDLTKAVAGALEIAKKRYADRREQVEFGRRLAELSDRQREILHHIVLGKANKLIAYELGISERTVEVHRYRLMRRMAVGSAVELARLMGSFATRTAPLHVAMTPTSSGHPDAMAPLFAMPVTAGSRGVPA